MNASRWGFLVVLCGAALAQAAPPKAYLLDHADQWTHAQGAAALLREAGFSVEPLPLDRSPRTLADTSDLIFLAAFSSEHPGYADYIARYGDELYHYVDKGNVLVQMTQADQVEAQPPFLPSTHGARRGDADFAVARVVSPNHPLLAGIADGTKTVQLDATSTVWESFVDQSGFEVLLAGDGMGAYPALMEGAYGQGRIVLASMAFDKNVPRSPGEGDPYGEARRAFNAKFFANLAQHVMLQPDQHFVFRLDAAPQP